MSFDRINGLRAPQRLVCPLFLIRTFAIDRSPSIAAEVLSCDDLRSDRGALTVDTDAPANTLVAIRDLQVVHRLDPLPSKHVVHRRAVFGFDRIICASITTKRSPTATPLALMSLNASYA